MKSFLDQDFLLSTSTARRLFHEYAEDMPIFDYHCHLNPAEILENIQFENIGQLMLGGDHYKWRAMLSNGVPEKVIYTPDSEWERFYAYAGMLKYAIGNPLYHWTHLELQRVFGIDDILTEKSARSIWDRANELLKREDFRCRALIEKFNVRVICTTDDPKDDLTSHRALAQDASFTPKVLASFRPDRAVNPTAGDFAAYLRELGEAAGIAISGMEDLLDALDRRADYFHRAGVRISDHGLDSVPVAPFDEACANHAFEKAMAGEALTDREAASYKVFILTRLGGVYQKYGWTMQLHMNALRNNNTRKLASYGANTGFDSVSDDSLARGLSGILDAIECESGLPRTILYSLNPADNYVIGTMLGNFQGGVPGKVQMGSGWWFQDQRDGMVAQIKTLANLGLLGRFVGMLTDSRSFISYPRHEYFRRILCEVIGGWVENGEYPADFETLGELVQGICYKNAVSYFEIPVDR